MSHIHFAPQCGSLCSWSSGPSGSVNNRVNFRETERKATLWVPSSATLPPWFCFFFLSLVHHHQSPAGPGSNSRCGLFLFFFFSSLLTCMVQQVSSHNKNKLPVIVKTLHHVVLKYSMCGEQTMIKSKHFGKMHSCAF